MSKCIAAYDFGTSGVKIVLFDLSGNILSLKEKGYSLYHPSDNYVEQDPEEYWSAVCSTTKEALEESDINPSDVVALSFSVQAVTLIPVSNNGNVLYPAVSWLDKRAEQQALKINSSLGAKVVRSQDFQPRLLWFKEMRPDIYNKTAYFLDCNGFLQYKATGIMSVPDDHPGIASTHPEIAAFYNMLMEVAEIDQDKWPNTVEATKIYGRLDENGAKELGLSPGTPVFGGCIDVPAAAAGAGCVKKGDANVYLGSSGWLSVLVDEPVEAAEGSYFISSIDSKILIYGGCINSCCMTVNWITDMLYSKEKKQLNNGCWDLINMEVSNVPPGCDGMMATPWLYGEQFPVCDDNLRATFLNGGIKHTRGHFVAAVMESICFSVRWQKELYEKDYSDNLKQVVVNGGGSLSTPWMQMMADVLQLPIFVPADTVHSGAIGAAVAAAIGLNVCNYDTINNLIKMEKHFEPRKEYRKLYDERFKMFKQVYNALKPIYKTFNERGEKDDTK